MAIAFRGSNSGSNSSQTSSITVAPPANLAAGDLHFVACCSGGGVTLTGAGGFTLISSGTFGGGEVDVFMRMTNSGTTLGTNTTFNATGGQTLLAGLNFAFNGTFDEGGDYRRDTVVTNRSTASGSVWTNEIQNIRQDGYVVNISGGQRDSGASMGGGAGITGWTNRDAANAVGGNAARAIWLHTHVPTEGELTPVASFVLSGANAQVQRNITIALNPSMTPEHFADGAFTTV